MPPARIAARWCATCGILTDEIVSHARQTLLRQDLRISSRAQHFHAEHGDLRLGRARPLPLYFLPLSKAHVAADHGDLSKEEEDKFELIDSTVLFAVRTMCSRGRERRISPGDRSGPGWRQRPGANGYRRSTPAPARSKHRRNASRVCAHGKQRSSRSGSRHPRRLAGARLNRSSSPCAQYRTAPARAAITQQLTMQIGVGPACRRVAWRS